MSNSQFNYKIVRDPLYGFISLSKEETSVIDSEVFQRLGRIKQLSHAYVVYPSAIHTRFEHSLGATHIANRISDILELDKNDKRIVRLTALLHDVGHGPFSHLFEEIVKKINPGIKEPHELISRSLIQTDPELDSVLQDTKSSVIEILEKKQTPEWYSTGKSLLADIVSGSLDADKLDYLRRDSYHLGVAYGQFDLERILHTLTRTPDKRPQLCMDSKGIESIENYRLARYLMHAQVYEHHARLVADQMFLKSLDIAIHEEKIIDGNLLKLNDSNYESNKSFLDFYKTLDDYSIYELILKHPDAKTSKNILTNIRRRKLLKRICQFTPNDISHPTIKQEVLKMKKPDLDKIANDTAASLGLESHEVIFYESNINIKLFGDADILFLNRGTVHDVKESSPISAAKFVVRYYVFGPNDDEIQKKIADKISERLNVPVENIQRRAS